jgi:hypothetical protein
MDGKEEAKRQKQKKKKTNYQIFEKINEEVECDSSCHICKI